jgi:3-hydroxyisobutyrate dehydrogenase
MTQRFRLNLVTVGTGIIGIGNMGGAMWQRLHECDVEAVVHDLRPDLAAALGAPLAPSAGALIEQSDVVVLSLPTSRHVQAVVDESRDAFRDGTLVIDTTTGVPSISRAVARTLAGLGVHYVDCGISGGPHGARAGALKIMIGGGDEAFALAQPVIQHLGARIWRCGDVGNGHAMKAVLNLSNQNKLLVELEALALGAKSGLDPQVVADVLDLAVWKDWLLGADGRRPFGFPLALFAKDFDVANTVATDAGVVLPLGAAGQQLARQLRIEAGDDADLIDAVAVVERWSGVDFEGGAS